MFACEKKKQLKLFSYSYMDFLFTNFLDLFKYSQFCNISDLVFTSAAPSWASSHQPELEDRSRETVSAGPFLASYT